MRDRSRYQLRTSSSSHGRSGHFDIEDARFGRTHLAAPSRGVPGQPVLPSGARVLPLQVPPGRGHREGRHGEGHLPEPRQWRRRHPDALPRLLRRGIFYMSES